MKDNEYQCTMCDGIFEKKWTDEEAEKECVENFGTMMAHDDDRAIVCDDCYQKIIPSEHPEEMERAKEEFLSKRN